MAVWQICVNIQLYVFWLSPTSRNLTLSSSPFISYSLSYIYIHIHTTFLFFFVPFLFLFIILYLVKRCSRRLRSWPPTFLVSMAKTSTVTVIFPAMKMTCRKFTWRIRYVFRVVSRVGSGRHGYGRRKWRVEVT